MVNSEVVAVLVVHVDDIIVATAKEVTDSGVGHLGKRLPTKLAVGLRGTCVASAKEIRRRIRWRM